MKKIYIIDAEKELADALVRVLTDSGYFAAAFYNAADAMDAIYADKPDLVFLDIRMPDMDEHTVFNRIKDMNPDIKIVIITANTGLDRVKQLLDNGAVDFIAKPFNLKEIYAVIKQVLSGAAAIDAEIKERRTRIIGQSEGIIACIDTALKLSNSNAAVLIYGETGTGKEFLAEFIHYNSIRKYNNFVKINCAAIPQSLLESELFGYEKGAFTGAGHSRAGKFEAADQGTIFLDEVGDMDLYLQAKILRVLEYKSFEKLGSNKAIETDFRLICATNKLLHEEVLEGRFREDLYYRLNTVTITVPPLRERCEDIEPLAEFFIQSYHKEYATPAKYITSGAIEILKDYEWPGNIRELKNVIHRAIILERGTAITEEQIRKHLCCEPGTLCKTYKGLHKLADIEDQYILKVLRKTRGNKKEASRILGISERTLYNKMHKIGK